MKKMTIAFTILCVGALNGMEPKNVNLASSWQDLPIELKGEIILALAQSGDDLGKAVNNIIKLSLVNKQLNAMIHNFGGINIITNILANKFGIYVPNVAQNFKTEGAQLFVNVYRAFEEAVKNSDVNKAQEIIDAGLSIKGDSSIIFTAVIHNQTAAMIKFLLDNGAIVKKPKEGDNPNGTLLGYLSEYKNVNPEYETIKKMLEEAIQKQ